MSDYDLVVIGAGSAGGVIASRVTEDPTKRVLLIEAGPDYSDLDATPTDLQNVNKNSLVAHDWGFMYQPNAFSRATVPLPRGKVVGGSSAVNTAIALRGQPEDYDEWASMAGPEWAWEKCLPAFKRLENDQDIHNDLHGCDGPIPIRRHTRDELVPVQRASMDAAKRLGYPECPDHNDPATTGYGPHPMNKQGRLRMSVAITYLAQARARSNLTIRPHTLVRRVVVRDGRVTGVELETDGAVETVDATRVVLSGGAIQTPAMLVRSGIGPRETLDRLGVAVLKDAPGVGAKLLDHPGSMVVMVPRPGLVHGDQPLIQTTLRYTAKGSDDFNDMQLEPISFIQRLDDGGPLFTGLAAVVEKTHGHGWMRFESADVHAQPVIESNFLADEWDLDRMVEGIEIGMQFAETPEMREVCETVVRPRPEEMADRDLMRAWLRRACGSGYHPSGTAPMGAPDDEAAVCGQYGRVFGVEGLFLADASIMPSIPRANTNIPTIMIGERFGEWLRDGVI